MLAFAATSLAATVASPPLLVGTPSVTYAVSKDRDGSFVTVGTVFRTDRALDRAQYAALAAPALKAGLRVPDELFGGTTAGRVGRAAGHCYAAEAIQLKRRARVTDRTWQLALVRDDLVTGRVKHVTLKPARGGWELRAARRLGC